MRRRMIGMRRKSVKIICELTLSIILAATLVACGGASSGNSTTAGASAAATETAKPAAEKTAAEKPEKTLKMKLGLSFADSHLITDELRVMAQNIKDRTNGGIEIEVFADSLLGSETQMYEQLQMGTLEIALESIAFQSTAHPELTVEDLPYMFATKEDGYAALEGDYGKKINEIIASDGIIRNLGFMELGYRHMTNNLHPIVKPEDVAGIKFRTTTSDLRLAVFESLGAQPISMGWSEVFTALQQKVIDGQETPLSSIYSSSLYEVQKYLSLTGHFWTNECMLINEQLWESLPAEWQQIMQEEAKACEDRIHQRNADEEDNFINELKAKGMEINEVDKAAFKEALEPLYDEWEEKVIGKDLMDAYKKYSGY